jgi:glycosyltransferase involved in cell wall biosynthesis
MRVLFDVSCLDHDRISGVGTYARHLADALAQDNRIQLTGSFRLSRHRSLPMIRRHWPGELAPYIPLWSDWRINGFEVFHGPDYRIPGVRGLGRVVTIHDLAFFEPGYSAPRFARSRQQGVDHLLHRQKPDAVIAVSEFTRRKILERYPEFDGRVHTVWHGADHLLVPVNRGLRPLPEPYYLFVGNLESRKNLVGLLRAFSILKARPEHKETRLILVGKPGYGFEEIKSSCRGMKAAEHVVLPGFINNIGLVNYYQWAEAFVYPSHYEGFGFPVLEAMRLGCPVITSSVSATPEVAGDAALLVNPGVPEDIAEAMLRVAQDRELRENLISRGRSRGNQFTWRRCAAETLAVYEKVRRSR